MTLDDSEYLLQGIQEVHAGQFGVFCQMSVVVSIIDAAATFHKEPVIHEVETLFHGGFALDG